MSEVFDYEFYCGASWTIKREYFDPVFRQETTHQQYTATIKFQYTYDGNLNPRDLFICQESDMTDRLDREYERFLFFSIRQGENVNILNYNGSSMTYTIHEEGQAPETTTYHDESAMTRVRSLQPIAYESYSEEQGISYNASLLYISNLSIMNDQTEPWTYKGYAYKNGKYYDEPLNLDDPYTEDTANDEGTQGTNDWTPDNITEKELPPDFYGNSGLIKVLTPTTAELNAFASYLWNDNFDIDQFKKIVNNPFDLILGFQYMPLKVTIAGQIGINVGNILSVDTGLTMSYPTQENYKHSFGTLNLTGQESKFLDYAPYSRTFIHLPYIGTQAIDTDLIRKCSPVELIYKYNIVTGTICAYLKGSISGQNGILYEWEGNVNNTIPVASNDYSNSISGMFNLVSGAVVGGISGGAIGGGVGAAVGAISGAVSGLNQADLKPTITSQGSIGGSGACLNATNDAFIVTIQQRLSVANQQAHYLGYPRNISGKIKNSKGYNNIKGCRMSCSYAYQEELREIEDILINGYIYGDSDGNVISKPTTPSGDNVAFALYQNKSSNIRIDKSLDHLHTYDCILKDSTNIVNPTIRIKATDVNVTRGNYGYIPKFKRFYYVNNVRSINADIWDIDLHCDVLMSFRDDIIEHTVIFNHSESAYNLYLNDGSLQMDSRPKITWNKFPNSLTNDGTYVLLLAGA